jgi:hypothetical protein
LDTYDNVDALGIVSRLAVPLQFVDVNDVEGILPVPDIVIDFVPSELWLTVTVEDTAVTHSFSVIVNTFDAVVLVPSMVMENEPVP